MKTALYILLGCIALSCEDKETVADETFSINASFGFSGTSTWPERYMVVLGAFEPDRQQPLQFVEIEKPGGDSASFPITINGVPYGAKKIKLYLSNSGHQEIYSFFDYDITTVNEGISMPHAEISLLQYSRVQGQVFNNSCIVCHGGSSGEPAAGLVLTEGNSYESLVGHPSVNSGKNRVVPGDAGNSFIIDVLTRNNIPFVHSASSTIPEEDIQLIKAWIIDGAKP